MKLSYNKPFDSRNSGGMNPSGVSAPITSGGDVVLSSGEEKKSKKGLIIGIIAATVLLVGVIVAVVLVNGGGRGNSANSGTATKAFLKYANYLIDGEESTAALVKEDDEDEQAMIYSMLNPGEEESVSYIGQLNRLWDGFVGIRSNFDFGDGLTKVNYEKRLDFLSTYVNDGGNITDDFSELATNRSLDSMKSMVDDYVAVFSEYNFDEALTFADAAKNYYGQMAEMAEELKTMGCVGGLEGNGTCLEERVAEVELKYETTAVDYYVAMTSMVTAIADYVVDGCWNINTALQEGK